MSVDTDRLLSMSLLLKAIDDCDQELTEFKAEHKALREKLMGELTKLRWEVLSGQDRLPLESVSESVVAWTASAAPDAESSVEERARAKKNRKAMQGQDAILPDHRPTQAPAQPPAGD
jgi:hypothetical protein